MTSVVGQRSRHLEAFLSCTLSDRSPVSKLRGHGQVLRLIWTLVCEEWWDLHIERFPSAVGIPDLTLPWKERVSQEISVEDGDDLPDMRTYPRDRQRVAGCPVATIAKNVAFPTPTIVPMGTFKDQESEHLYVNMMPFDPWQVDSLPKCCRGYWPMIAACMKMSDHQRAKTAYLTIDERPTPPGSSQRRPGLHVESPGVLPVPPKKGGPDAPYRVELPGGRFVPGAEHHWGGGLMMRHECVQGGIFMASNVAGTTAVWNCHINNEGGQFVGPHGDIEHLRPLLGPPSHLLKAGELIWMTDRTPHESLPVPRGGGNAPTRRQYFRLVVGTVSAWFAHHSTPNPLGYRPDPSVRIVRGNKFTLLGEAKRHRNWHCGTAEQLRSARDFAVLRGQLYLHGLGHLVTRFHEYGITSIARLIELHNEHRRLAAETGRRGIRWHERWGPTLSSSGAMSLFEDNGAFYYDMDQMEKLLKACMTVGR